MFVKPPIELSWSHTQAIEGLKFIGSQVLTAWEQGVSVALESTRIGNKSISKENPFIWLEQSMQKYKYATTYKTKLTYNNRSTKESLTFEYLGISFL